MPAEGIQDPFQETHAAHSVWKKSLGYSQRNKEAKWAEGMLDLKRLCRVVCAKMVARS